MKSLIQFTLAVLLFVLAASPSAAFTSLRVYGDSLSCTTNNPDTSSSYYGERYSNGRVWVEVLAQQQGLIFNSNLNNSYYANYSTNIWNNLKTAPAPSDSNTTLVVIWANNADLFDLANDPTTTLPFWTNTINWSQTNHYSIITNLYAKGVRSMVMPNVVDLSSIPRCNHPLGGTYTNTIRQKCITYNLRFADTLARAKTNCPGLTIYTPDFFTLLTNLLASPASYGVTNALFNYGSTIASVDAISALGGNPSVTNNPGTNYIFWDQFNPSAKVHYIMASEAQQKISPVKINQIISANGTNLLEIGNVPVYTNTPQNGLILISTNLAFGNWTTNRTFTTTNILQYVPVTNSEPQAFFRVQFPYVWNWP